MDDLVEMYVHRTALRLQLTDSLAVCSRLADPRLYTDLPHRIHRLRFVLAPCR